MAATVPAEPVVPARRTRLGSVRRGFAPVSDARGMTRTMLFLGAAITLLTGRSVLASGARQLGFGLAAAGLTYVVGRLIGASVAS